MNKNDLIYKLNQYPKTIIEFLRVTSSQYITMHQMSHFTGIDIPAIREFMYDLMSDSIVEKYQTTFRLTNEFMKLRSTL